MSSKEQRVYKEPERPVAYEPPDLQGRKHVQKVAGEYRIREDECLADKLQNEEFALHFGMNRSERFQGKIDIKTAKQIYLREVEQSGLLSKEEMNKLCEDDKFLAGEVEKRLAQEADIEVQQKQAVEMQDEEFARYLGAKERQRYEDERKRRLQRRVKQEKVEGEHFQEERDDIIRGVRDLQINKHQQQQQQTCGWRVDCELGTSLEAQTNRKHIEEQRDEVMKRVEEERDRRIAMKLQKQEAEEYRRRKQDREFRRIQSERRDSPSAGGSELESVNGESEERNEQNTKRPRSKSNPSRSKSERGRQQSHSSAALQSRQKHNEELERTRVYTHESPYLIAVDSPRRKEERDKGSRSADKEKIRQQQEILKQSQHSAMGESNEQYRDESNGKPGGRSASRNQLNEYENKVSRKHSNERRLLDEGNSKLERTLADDQQALRYQAQEIERLHSKNSQKQHRSVRSSSSKEPTWDLQVTGGKSQERLGNPNQNGRHNTYESSENITHYNTKSGRQDIDYNNIARNIDPTYQTIGPASKVTGQVGILEPENTVAGIPPVPVIQNVKRSSKEENRRKKDNGQKKKKWFSKKE